MESLQTIFENIKRYNNDYSKFNSQLVSKLHQPGKIVEIVNFGDIFITYQTTDMFLPRHVDLDIHGLEIPYWADKKLVGVAYRTINRYNKPVITRLAYNELGDLKPVAEKLWKDRYHIRTALTDYGTNLINQNTNELSGKLLHRPCCLPPSPDSFYWMGITFCQHYNKSGNTYEAVIPLTDGTEKRYTINNL